MNRYENAKEFILNKQANEFPDNLFYHGIHHVMDVLESAIKLSEAENISRKDTELLKLAVLFHDAGYIYNHLLHEEKSCEIAAEVLPGFGYTVEEIRIITNLILATRTPQNPKTHLEKIICDADMDYLGRDDYYSISSMLLKELSANGQTLTTSEWNRMQLKFLEQHSYFTETSRRMRNEKKQAHIEALENLISHENGE